MPALSNWAGRTFSFAVECFIVMSTVGCASQAGIRAHLSAGDESHRAARYEQAAAEYSKAIRLATGQGTFGRSDLSRAYASRGLMKERLGRHKLALNDYDKAIQLAFTDPAPYLRRARLHYRSGQYDKAAADYTEALRLRPDDGRTHKLACVGILTVREKRAGNARRADGVVPYAER